MKQLLLFVCAFAFAKAGALYHSSKGEFDGIVRTTEEGRLDALLPKLFPQAHAPFLLQSFDGDLFIAWFSGEAEGASRCAIVVSRFDFDAKRWRVPVVASVETGKSNQNPVLFQRPSERSRIYLLHPSQDAGPFGVSQRTSEIRLLHSDDGCTTWSTPTVIFPRGRGSFPRGPVLTSSTDADTLLLPMYFTPAGEFDHDAQYSAIVRSRDGVRWTDEARIPGSEGAKGVQPQMVRLRDGRLVAFMRNRTQGSILRSGFEIRVFFDCLIDFNLCEIFIFRIE